MIIIRVKRLFLSLRTPLTRLTGSSVRNILCLTPKFEFHKLIVQTCALTQYYGEISIKL